MKRIEKDTFACYQYLERKLKLNPYWLSEDEEIQFQAEETFNKVKCDTVTLQKWCDEYLNVDQLKQMKNAIRAQKCRSNRKKGEGTKNVTLSHRAWLILSDGAKRDKVTLSDWIVNRLENEWLSNETES